MTRDQDHIDELIGKYLAGEASAEEYAFVKHWATESEHNQAYLDEFNVIYTKSANIRKLQHFDTDAAWEKLKASIAKPTTKVNGLPKDNKQRFVLIWKIAASIVLVLGIGLYFYVKRSDYVIQTVVVAATNQTMSDTLPDGSNVFLNKQSRLSYSFDKKSKEHKVELDGEAYFKIRHDQAKKFIVHIDGILIRDIGTSFNVKAYKDSNTVEVVVEEGEVMFYTENDSGIYLRENAKGIYDKKLKQFTIEQPETNVLAYKTKMFSFNNTDLQSVVRELNDVYPTQIVLPPSLYACHLTVSFNNETQDEIIAVISETLGLTAHHSNGKILLAGEGCEP